MARAGRNDKIAEAAFRALAKSRWDRLKLADVAKAAGLPLAALLREVPSKSALIGFMLRQSVAGTLRRYRPDRASHTARERLFDVAMAWFEAQAMRKPAFRNFHEGVKRDPLALLSVRDDILAASGALIALAGADDGPTTA